jgi:hypothetical protein
METNYRAEHTEVQKAVKQSQVKLTYTEYVTFVL